MRTALFLFFCFSCILSCQNADSGKQPAEPDSALQDSSDQHPAEDTLTLHESNKAASPEFDWTPESVAEQKSTPSFPSAASKSDPVLPPVPVQSFTFRANQEQILKLKDGTLLGFEAGAFEQNGKPVTGAVTLKVKEYTQLSDFLAEGMSTVSNGQLLETGGSLDVSATFKGQKCELAKGKPMRIAFRRNKEIAGMETFTGQKTNGRINWIRQKETTTSPLNDSESNEVADEEKPTPTTKRNLTEPEKEKLDEYLALHFVCPPFLREFKLGGVSELKIHTDETGCFRSFCVKESVHELFDRALLFTLENCPFPLIKSRVETEFVYSTQTRGNFVNAFDHPVQRDVQYTKQLNRMNAVQCFNPPPVQAISSYGFSQQSIDRKIRKQGFESLNEAEAGFYFISSSRLGLVNCDHFFQNNKPKTNFTVRIEAPVNSWIYMIFPDNKVIAQPFQNDNCGEFVNVPIGEKARILSFGKKGKQYFMKYMDVEISENGILQKQLEPITAMVFEKEMKSLANEFARL